MIYLSGAKIRVGLVKEIIDATFYTHPVSFDEHKVCPDVLRNLGVLTACGLKVKSKDLEIWFDGQDVFHAKKLLGNFGEGRIKVAVGIGANDPQRKYPIEKYLVAFKEIIEKGASLIIIGGPSELDDAKFLENNLPEGSVKNLVEVGAGWRVDVAAMSLTDMYIGNFTGACDIAAALKKPVIILTPVAKDRKEKFPDIVTELEIYHPWKTNSIVLQPEHQLGKCTEDSEFTGCSAGKSHCIAQIEPSEIVRAFDDMIYFKKTIRFKEC